MLMQVLEAVALEPLRSFAKVFPEVNAVVAGCVHVAKCLDSFVACFYARYIIEFLR